ncbi:MAG: hypothetical protein AAFY20_10080, partial [Cyanobacteria bacterium J06639_14]
MKILIATIGWMMVWAIAIDALRVSSARADEASLASDAELPKASALAKPEVTSIPVYFPLGTTLLLGDLEASAFDSFVLADNPWPLQSTATPTYTVELEQLDRFQPTESLRVVPTHDGYGVVVYPQANPSART